MDLLQIIGWWAVQATAILLVFSLLDRFFIRRPQCRKALIRMEIFLLLIQPIIVAMRQFGIEIGLPVQPPPMHAVEYHAMAFDFWTSEGHLVPGQHHESIDQGARFFSGQGISLAVSVLLICGVLARLIGLCRSVRSNCLTIARCRPIPLGWKHADLIRNVAKKFNVSIKFSNEVNCPCVIGIGFNSIVVLPDKVENLTREAFRCILLHEVHHARDCDAQWRLAQKVTEVIYWWHPLLLALSAKLIRIDDDVSDSFAANHSRVESVAKAIAEFTKLNLKDLRANHRPCYLNRRSDAVRRVKFLLDPRRSFMTRSSSLFRACVLVVALGCVVVGIVELQPATAQTDRQKEPASQPVGGTRLLSMTDESNGTFGNGVAAFYAGHHERAAKIFASIAESTTDDPLVHFYFAGSLNELGRTTEARDQLTLAIRLKPDFSEAYYHRGMTYRKLNQLDLAKADLSNIVSQKAAITHLALDALADLAIADGDYDAAILFASQSIKAIPTAGRPWYLRGRAHFENGDTDQATADIQRAFDLGYGKGKL